MSLIEAALLGIIQGLTEFLPISSSGHLVLAQAIMGIKVEGIAFDIFVHFGTLLAVITFYRKDLIGILADCLKLLLGSKSFLKTHEENYPSGAQLLGFIIIGVVPTGILGLLFKDFFESTFSNLVFVSSALIFTSVLLTLTRLAKDPSQPLNMPKSFLIGLAQVIAFFPGVSRSGTTITAALLLGVKPTEAARYSFLLAVPLILGVTLLQSLELMADPPTTQELVYYGVGCLTAFLSGLWAIKWLLTLVQGGRFARFAYYCFTIGAVGLGILLF